MYRPSGLMTSSVESDITGPLCQGPPSVLQLLVYWLASCTFMFLYVNLHFLSASKQQIAANEQPLMLMIT